MNEDFNMYHPSITRIGLLLYLASIVLSLQHMPCAYNHERGLASGSLNGPERKEDDIIVLTDTNSGCAEKYAGWYGVTPYSPDELNMFVHSYRVESNLPDSDFRFSCHPIGRTARACVRHRESDENPLWPEYGRWLGNCPPGKKPVIRSAGMDLEAGTCTDEVIPVKRVYNINPEFVPPPVVPKKDREYELRIIAMGIRRPGSSKRKTSQCHDLQ